MGVDWLQLLISGVIGAIAGALASTLAARRVAKASELGRLEETARQRLLDTVRLYRAQVYSDRIDAHWRMAMGSEYLASARGVQLAEDIERGLAHTSRKLATELRDRLVRLVGPVDAHMARTLSPIPVADRDEKWREVGMLQTAHDLSAIDVEDRGLIGKARKAPLIGEHVREIVLELDEMEALLEGRRVRSQR